MASQHREAGRIISFVVVVLTALILVATVTWASIRQSRVDDKKLAQNAIRDVRSQAEQCSTSPKLSLPVESSSISTLTYPGLERDGAYVTTSRLKLKSSTNEVRILLPLKARLVGASRYVEQGETQYMLSFETSCKYKISYDHLSVVALEFLDDISKLPDRSASTKSLVKIAGKEYDPGAVVATRAGYVITNNTFFDFGLYNSNSVNSVSADSVWAKNTLHQSEDATHGVCWLDYLSTPDKANVEPTIQADPLSKTGDYCK